MGRFNDTGYSARVRIWLECAGQKITLAQSSSTFVIAKDPVDLPPNSPARIVVTVDDEQYDRQVTLIHGMSRSTGEAMVLERDHLPF